jgi:thiol-disulfide isomerase/thioredoxin
MKKIIFMAILLLAAIPVIFSFGNKESKTAASQTPSVPQPAESSRVIPTPSGPEKSGSSGSWESVAEDLRKAGIGVVKEPVPIADFTLPKLGGGTISLSGLKGKVVFLNFWATWCPPCRAEMPSMEKLYGLYKSDGLEILAVNLQEDEKIVRDFMKKNGLSFPVALDGSGKTGGTYGVRGIPTTFIVDRESRIIGSVVGGKEWDTPEVLQAFKTVLSHGK